LRKYNKKFKRLGEYKMAENKGLFERIGDALSTRDEIKAMKDAQADAAAARNEAAAAVDAATEAQSQAQAAEEARAAEEAQRLAAEAVADQAMREARAAREARDLEAEVAAQERANAAAAAAEAAANYEREVAMRAAAEAAAKRTYVVKAGDSLWAIAAETMGNGARYQELYEANKHVIGSNPNMIQPGMELTIPS
jgi:nucleoid-associated protein YgaU